MVVAQNGASYDRKIRIGSEEIMRELFHKIKELYKGRPVNFHRDVFSVEYNTVFIVINIR